MGSTRFVPARIFIRRRNFGRTAWGTLNSGEGLDEGLFAAAYFQHQAAFAVRDYLDHQADSHLALEELAHSLGENRDWLVRKLHGQATASLAEMSAWLIAVNYEAPLLDDAIAVAEEAKRLYDDWLTKTPEQRETDARNRAIAANQAVREAIQTQLATDADGNELREPE